MLIVKLIKIPLLIFILVFFICISPFLGTSKEYSFMLQDGMKKSTFLFEWSNIFEVNYNLIDHVQFFEFIYRPSFIFGSIQFGFGFMFPISFTMNQQTKELHMRDIDYNNIHSILSKLDFIQYSFPKDPIFIKVAPLQNITLNHGLLVLNYQNSLAPRVLRNIGLFFKIHKRGILFEGFISEFYHATLIGLNLSFNIGKIIKSKNIYLNHLKFGITSAIDHNTNYGYTIQNVNNTESQIIKTQVQWNNHEKDLNKIIAISGNFETLLFQFITQSSLHFIMNYAKFLYTNGQAINFGLFNISNFNTVKFQYNLEFQYLFSSNFLPGYFNLFYEINRHSKLESNKDNKGDYGFILNLRHFFLNDKIEWNIFYRHIFPYNFNEFSLYFKVYNAIDRLHIGLGYTRRNIKKISDLMNISNSKSIFFLQFLYGIGRFVKISTEVSKEIYHHNYKDYTFKTLRNYFYFSIFIKVAI